MAVAISVACVSSAKCPVSRKSIFAFGKSFRNASAPAGMKNGSFLPKWQVEAVCVCENTPETSDTTSRSMRSSRIGRAGCLCFRGVLGEPCPRCTIRARHVRDGLPRVCTASAFPPASRCCCEYLPVLCRGRGPVLPDRTPGISETLFVRVPVLRNDRGDSIGLTHRQPETGWRAIVEHIKCVAVELERLREGMYGQRQSSKRVTIVSFRRDLGESETRKVRAITW